MQPRSRRSLVAPLTLAATFALVAPLGARAQDEFSAQGVNVIRIENEVKLSVPLELTEDVWTWLQARYADCGWLAQEGTVFRATFGDEDFHDVYFDEPTLPLLAEQSGIRHRSRTIRSGSAMAKDGRQLLQIKLNRADPTGLARSEIKFEVRPQPVAKSNDDIHPLLGLVHKSQRDECKARIREIGLDPYALRPILSVDQNRRRVYVSDQIGAFATLTLDRCSSQSWGQDVRWTEIELELNEVRYTEADPEGRAWMESVNQTIQADLLKAFPAIVQDQTPKYNKSFEMIEQRLPVPMRRLVRAGLDLSDFITLAVLVTLAVGAGGALFVRSRRRLHPEVNAA